MILSMKEHLKSFLAAHPEIPDGDRMQLPDISLDPDSIRIMMISHAYGGCGQKGAESDCPDAGAEERNPQRFYL